MIDQEFISGVVFEYTKTVIENNDGLLNERVFRIEYALAGLKIREGLLDLDYHA